MTATSDQRAGFAEILLREADAALELTGDDTRQALCAALSDMFPGEYSYVRDVIGDGESGDVIYCCQGDCYRASYEIGMTNGSRYCSIDDDSAIEVICRTVYDPVADDDDHMVGSVEAAVKSGELFERFPGSSDWRVPFRERFISKSERDSMDAGDFAGNYDGSPNKKSYPIKTRADVMAAVRSMGRGSSAGHSMTKLKNRIKTIAKRKGFGDELPKTWQGDTEKVAASARRISIGELALVESAVTLEQIVLKEARADYEIKLIAPGKGSSAFYPAEVLKRDGPKVFKAGTHVYLNHPTAAEEAARPEGDVANLAAVTSTDAVYHEAHAKGPGLYARMKVFADHAQMVEEKAAHVGMSIRASGIKGGNKTRDGLPVLKELTHAESVDVVTRAGAGGMILSESATGATPTQEVEMTDQQITALVESATTAAVTKALAAVQTPVKLLEARALRGDAMVEANGHLREMTLPESAKQRVIEAVTREGVMPLKDGQLDSAKFKELVIAEAKREGAYLASVVPGGNVIGMGSARVGEGAEPTKEERKRLKEEKRARKDERREAVEIFESLGMPKDAAKLAARKDVA